MTAPPTSPTSPSMTPGRYLQLRREDAGKSLADVAAEMGTIPHVPERDRIALLAQVEAGDIEVTMTIAVGLRRVFRFDERVLVALVEPTGLPLPDICTRCGCSWHDPCLDPSTGQGCEWTAPGLCSVCVPPADAAALERAA